MASDVPVTSRVRLRERLASAAAAALAVSCCTARSRAASASFNAWRLARLLSLLPSRSAAAPPSVRPSRTISLRSRMKSSIARRTGAKSGRSVSVSLPSQMVASRCTVTRKPASPSAKRLACGASRAMYRPRLSITAP